jgi:P-type conjugative transfer protein TrbJ
VAAPAFAIRKPAVAVFTLDDYVTAGIMTTDQAVTLRTAFRDQYGNVSMSASDQQLITDARSRWQNTVGGLQDAMRVQAGVVGNIDSNRSEMSSLLTQSQGATGALQATQAGNQILALQSQQLSDLVAVIAANGRASALTGAERAAAAEQGREQRRRFLTPGSGYTPGNVQMFNSGN